MVQEIVEKIIEKQLKEKMITAEDANIYRYGYALVFEVLINIIMAVFIGIVSGDLVEILLFLGLYIPLRSFCGGWHADKVWKCTIYSNLILVVMALFDDYCVELFNTIILLSVFGICMVFVFFWRRLIQSQNQLHQRNAEYLREK